MLKRDAYLFQSWRLKVCDSALRTASLLAVAICLACFVVQWSLMAVSFPLILSMLLLQTGATSSWNTGPPADHTTQNGYYMYIETSWPRRYGDKAWLVSRNFQAITPGSEPCKLRFFYHMYGDSAESLNVYIRTNRNGTAKQRVWYRVGSQGAIWNRVVVTLSSNKNFQVNFT